MTAPQQEQQVDQQMTPAEEPPLPPPATTPAQSTEQQTAPMEGIDGTGKPSGGSPAIATSPVAADTIARLLDLPLTLKEAQARGSDIGDLVGSQYEANLVVGAFIEAVEEAEKSRGMFVSGKTLAKLVLPAMDSVVTEEGKLKMPLRLATSVGHRPRSKEAWSLGDDGSAQPRC